MHGRPPLTKKKKTKKYEEIALSQLTDDRKYSHKKTDKNKPKIEMKISPVNDVIARKLSCRVI